METRIAELRFKEVISVADGSREEDRYTPGSCVRRFGEDIILVEEGSRRTPRRG